MSKKNTQMLIAPTAITELCGEIPDLILIKDSLSPYRKKSSLPGIILHDLPYLEVLVAVQKEKMPQFQENACKYLGSRLTSQDAKDFSEGLISLIECECQIGEEELLIYQFVESETLERFCELSGELIWREPTRNQDIKEFWGFEGNKIEVPLTALECTGSKTRYLMPSLSKGLFYGGIRTSLLLPAIVIHNRGRTHESMHEKAWKASICQLARDISPIDTNYPYILNTFDIYHRNQKIIPQRLKRYLDNKTRECIEIIESQQC